eukprot:857225-Rhodomonas_salina.8
MEIAQVTKVALCFAEFCAGQRTNCWPVRPDLCVQMEQRMLRKRASRTERLFAHLIDERSRENIEDSIDPDKDRSQESIEDLSELIKDDPDGSDSDVIDDHSSIGAGEISGILDVGDASTSPCPSPPPEPTDGDPAGDLPRREHGDRRRLSSAAKKAANSRPSPPRTSKRETFHKRPGQGTEEQSAHAKGHGNGRPTSAPSAASARHETARRQRPSSAHPLSQQVSGTDLIALAQSDLTAFSFPSFSIVTVVPSAVNVDVCFEQTGEEISSDAKTPK